MRTLIVALLVSLAAVPLLASATGCTPSVKQFEFQFDKAGQTIHAKKEFNDAGGTAPSSKAWPAVDDGDYEKAIQILLVVVRDHPDDAWAHYNLAVLHEARGKWDLAEGFIRDAMAIEEARAEKEGRTPNGRFRRELRYIERQR